MSPCSRRDFLKISTRLAVIMGLGAAAVPDIAEALSQLSSGNAPVVWLQGQSCSGCSISTLNTDHPGSADLLTGYISLKFHSTLSTATGQLGMDVLNQSIERGGYFLVIEGSVPMLMPEACRVGGELLPKQVLRAAAGSTAIIATGTCASFGGIPAAQNNPTGAAGVPHFLKQNGVDKKVICVPGCPVHPDWLVGTLVHVLKFGLPALDKLNRPTMFFSRLVHEQCPRFADYERENFAETYGEYGCLFKLGCVGPNTHADCSIRQWNSGTNFCMKAGAPCIGCAGESFARDASFAFYRHDET